MGPVYRLFFRTPNILAGEVYIFVVSKAWDLNQIELLIIRLLFDTVLDLWHTVFEPW
jgi:hypothetical protein